MSLVLKGEQMFRRFSANFAVISLFLDLLLIAIALFIATELRSPLSVLPFLQEIPNVKLPGILYFLFPVVWIINLLLFSVYDGRKNLEKSSEMASLLLGSLLAVISLAGILYLSYRHVSCFLFLMAVGLALILLVLWRVIAHMIFRWRGIHIKARRVLILGAGSIGRKVGDQICRKPQFGLTLVGYLDDDIAILSNQMELLGPLDATRKLVLVNQIDDVIISLPMGEHQRTTQIVCELQDLPIRIWVIPDYFALALHQARIEDLAGIPMLDLRAPALDEYQRMVKRGFDIVLSILLLPFILPIIAVIVVAIWLDDRGPVFYYTRRAGENGKVFTMIKFRTMVVNADKKLQEVMRKDSNGYLIHKTEDDPRVTRIGRFLRRASLDEVPQLLNVLKGDMSLVGPRPELPEFVERYDLWQRKRFAVPQGLTGWWQINGRSDKPMHLHTDEDLYYVQNYSIWFDLYILFKTIWTVLYGRGAY
jgi:exopolysaccharide biosynthesis polyprenyl glycosylphosphotransferase